MAQAFDVQYNNNEVATMDTAGNLQVDGSITVGKPSYVAIPPTGNVTLYSDGTALKMYDVNGNTNVVSAGGSGGGTQLGNTTVTGNLTVTGNETITGTVQATPAAATNTVLSTNVGNIDNFDRFRVDGNGKFNWGPGTGARDTDLYRSGVNALTTDGFFAMGSGQSSGTFNVFGTTAGVANNLIVGGTTALGDNGVGEIQLTNATTIPTTNATNGAIIYASGGGVFHRGPTGTVTPMVQSNRVGAPMSPTTLAETANRSTVTTSFAPTSGTLYIWSVWLTAGQTVNNIGFSTGTTAATSPTHSWTVLLDNTYKQQAHSTDKTNTAIPASTWQNYAMATPYTATYTGIYYMGIMITAGPMPTLLCNATAPAAQFITGTNVPTPLVGGLSSTGLTTPGTDGTTTYIAPTAASQTIYMYAT